MTGATTPATDSLGSLINLSTYKLDDPKARSAIVARSRMQLAEESCVVLPDFVPPSVAETMAAEALERVPLSHRRDVMLTAYAVNPGAADVPEDHATKHVSPFRQFVIATDLLPPGGAIMNLYQRPELVSLVADILDQAPLYRTADPLLSATATAMHDGDEHGWHFDSNDFVVSLLLQAPDEGGAFEFAPYIRGETTENFEDVAAVMSGRTDNVLVKTVEAGTLMIFCGRRALHRVSPIKGTRSRVIALFCFDRKPDMQFSDSARTRAVGRTQPHPASG